MNNATTFASREVCNLVFCDYKTKKPFLNCDFANTTSTELTGESVYAYGGQGHPKKVAFHGERGGTLTIETQMQTMKLYSLLTGADMEKAARFIKREELTATEAGKLTVTGTPVTGTVNVFAADDDCGTEIPVTATSSAITGEGIQADTAYVVYYLEEMSTGVNKIGIKATTFPKAFTVYGETFMKTEDDEVVPYKMVAYKCAPQGNLSLSFASSGDPSSVTITCDLMADEDGNLLDLIMIDGE